MKNHVEKNRFTVYGMHCASCASIISKKVGALEGVQSCNVSIATEQAEIVFDPGSVTVNDMNKVIEPLGYSIAQQNAHDKVHESESMQGSVSSQMKAIVPMAITSILVMVWEIGAEPLRIWPEMPPALMTFFHHLFPIFATYVLFVVGIPYLKGAYRFFRYGSANMDSLVGIGTTVAYLYSFIVSAFEDLLAPYLGVKQNYYDVTIVVIAFITFGKYLETRSKKKTGDAIQKLIDHQVKNALVVRNDIVSEIPASEVVVGDIMVVKPGQKIPTDGIIIEGDTSVDESMISGEPIPVSKRIGDTVIGSTINKQGSIRVRATKVGADTVLAQIIAMVEHAQSSKAPIERLADRVSAVFVPTVMGIAVLVFAIWLIVGAQFLPFAQALPLGLLSFVGVLVIACPCAMGLATPTAVIVGVGRAAAQGILIKDAESLQKLSSVNYVVFDKTGTLTEGAPELTDIKTIRDMNESDALHIIASLEAHSEHPIAHAIVKRARSSGERNYAVSKFSVLEGRGLKGIINKKNYFAGNKTLMSELSISTDDSIIDTFASEGKTPVILADSKKVLAYFGIADPVRDGVKQVVDRLHSLNIKTAMLTGDHRNTANYIARTVGIDTVIAEVLPGGKAEEIKKLQKNGHRIAMVGDGINDAPALVTADVGIAMGSGTDVAIESAGITLLGGAIAKVPTAIRAARATMAVIKQNLFWAFIYNIIGIPVAAGALYPVTGLLLSPAIAGGAMGFSSISVVLNSLRLKTKRI